MTIVPDTTTINDVIESLRNRSTTFNVLQFWHFLSYIVGSTFSNLPKVLILYKAEYAEVLK
jgi:hypothetical protein